MAGGQYFSPHQKKIVGRFYEHRDAAVTQKLGETLSELALSTPGKAQDKLWARLGEWLVKAGAEPEKVQAVLTSRDLKAAGVLVEKAMRVG